jgi:GNAT superfamily N-acetyltransferase
LTVLRAADRHVGFVEMNGFSIRQARASDTETVSSILQEAAKWLILRGTPLWKADELAPNKIAADVSGGLYWLADVDGASAGCVRFQTEDRLFWPDVPPEESAFIHRLAVRRQFAGGAVAGALIRWARARTAGLGRRYLRLDCEAKTKSLCAVYERAGFRKHSERQVGPYWVARYECELEDANNGVHGRLVNSPP